MKEQVCSWRQGLEPKKRNSWSIFFLSLRAHCSWCSAELGAAPVVRVGMCSGAAERSLCQAGLARRLLSWESCSGVQESQAGPAKGSKPS